MMRFLAAALLAVLLPVQGYAAACAQICAVAGGETGFLAAIAAAGDEGEHEHCAKKDPQSTPAHGDGETSTLGAGKCCQAHVFTLGQPAATASLEQAPPARTAFVARWSSFIADEPSPPPIRPFTTA